MRVRFNTCLAGNGWCHNAGDVADIPEDQAFNLIRGGIASPEPEPQQVETADVPQAHVETATVKTKPAPKAAAAAAK
jgi:hypothetical protein